MSAARPEQRRERDLHVHPIVAMVAVSVAALALGVSWQRWLSASNGLSVPTVALTLCLTIAIVLAYQLPLHVGSHTKAYLSSPGEYLLAVLVSPPLPATAA